MSYKLRVVDQELGLLLGLPAVSIEGAKGVGKTATAQRHADIIYDLEDPPTRNVITADPKLVTSHYGQTVLMDEWQHLPEVWNLVRRAVDAGARPGSFIFTGSATTRTSTHSGAGRIVSLQMRPLTLFERFAHSEYVSLGKLLNGEQHEINGQTDVGISQYVDEILNSGFPGMRGLNDQLRRAQLNGYIDRIVEHDFQELNKPIRKPQLLRSWMKAYAAATSTTASFETIRNASSPGSDEKPSKSTTLPYRDVLQRLWIVDPVEAWLPTQNHFAELAASPKHHLVDPALAARLLGLGKTALLSGEAASIGKSTESSMAGRLFESLVTLCVRVYAQTNESGVKHFRTHRGEREVDLIVERDDMRVIAMEIKLSASIDDHDVEHLVWLREKLGSQLIDCVVVNTGPYAYRRKDGIAVIPAALLGP